MTAQATVGPRRREWRDTARPHLDLPLPVLLGGGAAVAGLLALLAVALPYLVGATLSEWRYAGLGCGLVVTGVTAGTAAYVGQRLSAVLRELREQALRGLDEPAGPARQRRSPAVATREVAELANAVDALHLRLRVADEVAGQHRWTAEMASAGMFELLSDLVAAEESARGQLAAELHDTAAQSLMLARSAIAGVFTGRSVVGSASRAAEVLPRVAEFIEDAEEQVRAVMARTRPPALRDGDLAAAVAQLRDDLAARYGLDVRVEWPAEARPLPLVTAVTAYRFFQEALLNVVKHADVDDAEIRLEFDDDGLLASVCDEGPGFDPTAVKSEKGRHVGLGLLRERARLAGGSLTVVSEPDQGTRLTLRLPPAPKQD